MVSQNGMKLFVLVVASLVTTILADDPFANIQSIVNPSTSGRDQSIIGSASTGGQSQLSTDQNAQQTGQNEQQQGQNGQQLNQNWQRPAQNGQQSDQNGQQSDQNGQQSDQNGQQSDQNGQQSGQNEQQSGQNEQQPNQNGQQLENRPADGGTVSAQAFTTRQADDRQRRFIDGHSSDGSDEWDQQGGQPAANNNNDGAVANERDPRLDRRPAERGYNNGPSNTGGEAEGYPAGPGNGYAQERFDRFYRDEEFARYRGHEVAGRQEREFRPDTRPTGPPARDNYADGNAIEQGGEYNPGYNRAQAQAQGQEQEQEQGQGQRQGQEYGYGGSAGNNNQRYGAQGRGYGREQQPYAEPERYNPDYNQAPFVPRGRAQRRVAVGRQDRGYAPYADYSSPEYYGGYQPEESYRGYHDPRGGFPAPGPYGSHPPQGQFVDYPPQGDYEGYPPPRGQHQSYPPPPPYGPQGNHFENYVGHDVDEPCRGRREQPYDYARPSNGPNYSQYGPAYPAPAIAVTNSMSVLNRADISNSMPGGQANSPAPNAGPAILGGENYGGRVGQVGPEAAPVGVGAAADGRQVGQAGKYDGPRSAPVVEQKLNVDVTAQKRKRHPFSRLFRSSKTPVSVSVNQQAHVH